MITDLLISILDTLARWMLSAFPSSGPGTGVFSQLSNVTSNIGAMNYFLPVAEVFTAVLAGLVVFPALMGVTLVVWLVALIRGGSARG